MLLHQCNQCGTRNRWGTLFCVACKASFAERGSSEDVLDWEGWFGDMRWRVTEAAVHATNRDCTVTFDRGNQFVRVRRRRWRPSGFLRRKLEWGPPQTIKFGNVEGVKVSRVLVPDPRVGEVHSWTFLIRMTYEETTRQLPAGNGNKKTLDLGGASVGDSRYYWAEATAQAIMAAVNKMLGRSEG